VREGALTVHVVVHDQGAGRGRRVRAVQLDGRSIPRARVDLVGSGERRLEIWLESISSSRQEAASGAP
jgi:hypothetical protein